jgi:hypothetical protein
VARRSALELLRTLRRKEREQQARLTAAAAREADAAERALGVARSKGAAARAERKSAVAAATSKVDAGGATAGALAQGYRWHAATEQRIEGLAQDARRAAEAATVARAREDGARRALGRASTAETRVEERARRTSTEARVRDERREEESAADVWNANDANRRSRGRR